MDESPLSRLSPLLGIASRMGWSLILVLFLTAFCHDGASGSLELKRARMPVPVHRRTAAVYLEMENSTDRLIELTGLSSDISESVEIHETLEEEGMIRMQPLNSLRIGPGELKMKPGGLHIMLKDLHSMPAAGDEIGLTLHFRNEPDLQIQVRVVPEAELM